MFLVLRVHNALSAPPPGALCTSAFSLGSRSPAMAVIAPEPLLSSTPCTQLPHQITGSMRAGTKSGFADMSVPSMEVTSFPPLCHPPRPNFIATLKIALEPQPCSKSGPVGKWLNGGTASFCESCGLLLLQEASPNSVPSGQGRCSLCPCASL